MLFVLFVLKITLRRDWAAIAVFVLLAGTVRNLVSFTWATLPVIVIIGAIRATVLIRFGLVAEMAGAAVWTLFMISPMTLQTSAWYAGPGYGVFVFVGLIAVYGFKTALGGRRLIKGRSETEHGCV
jgi:hypothetical protein